MDEQRGDQQWYVVQRWQEYSGEFRVILVRMLSICVVFALHLTRHFQLTDRTESYLAYHRDFSAIIAFWLMATSFEVFLLGNRRFPAWLKYASISVDLFALTLLALRGDGAHSPVVLAYFVVVVLAALRFHLSLVWFATLAAIGCYMSLVGAVDKIWFDPEHTIPIVEQLATVCALGITGIVAGQIVRQSRMLANEFAARMSRS